MHGGMTMHKINFTGAASVVTIASLAVRQALQSWESLLNQLPIGISACDRDGVLVHYNERAAELWGQAPTLGDPHLRYSGAHKAYASDGTRLDFSDLPMAEGLKTGRPVRNREIVFERPDGSRIFALVNVEPLLGANGELVGAVNCIQDITERKHAEQAVRERERWYGQLLNALPAAIYTTDAEGRITFYNEAAVALSGRRPELNSNQWCVSWRLFTPAGEPMPHEECPMAVALKEGRPIRDSEAIAERPDGTRVPFLPYPTPLRDENGKIIGGVNMLVDITDRKRAEERQQVLVEELNHRVKNTLATVQALAMQTIRGEGPIKEMRETFSARLLALSRTHDQLTRGGWQWADLHALLHDLFAPYERDRVHLKGSPVQLERNMALTLAMVVHELATNAAKYGALSVPGGTLNVSWQKNGSAAAPQLDISWQEVGGPEVTVPAHKGFGSRLLEHGIEGQLKGKTELHFESTGVRCRMLVPLSPIG